MTFLHRATRRKFSSALVTGSTSGIGEALCHLLANQGINLIITGRDQQKLDQLSSFLGEKVKVTPLAVDLNNLSKTEEIVKLIHFYSPDLIINNAGFGVYGDAVDKPKNEQIGMLRVNCEALLDLTLEGIKHMKSKKQEGVILNVSSMAAFYVFPAFAVYAACKTFVLQLSQALDYETKPYGIRVLTACPGMVLTDFSHRAGGEISRTQQLFAMTSEQAAENIWWQIQNEKQCYIFDWKYRLGYILSKIIPESLLAKYLHQEILSRED